MFFLKFQLGVSKFQIKVSFSYFEGHNQSYEVRGARVNRFDYKMTVVLV